MAREKGIASFSANFEPQKSAPLDARMLVSTKDDLLSPAIWQANDGNTYTYVGMIVSVTSDADPANNGVYRLKAADYTDVNNWELLGTGAGSQGWQGYQGLDGFQGDQGSQGWQGVGGIDGTQGNQGDAGIDGVQGNQGDQGLEGVQGVQGDQGLGGVQGTQGNQGDEGVQGSQGNQGNDGAQGAQGNQGDMGVQGTQGNQGGQGAQGENGSGFLTFWFDSGGSDLTTPTETGTDIAFVDSNPDTITRVSGDFIADGWVVGQRVTVTGASSPGNNSTFVIANVASNTLTLSSAAALTPEGASANVTLLVADDSFMRVPPTDAEQDKSVEVTAADVNGVSINNYITITGIPGELSIPAGTLEFTGWFWTSVGSPTIKYEVCKRTAGGSTTVLFTTDASSAITALSNITAQKIQVSYVLGSPITLLETDRIVVRVLAFSDVDCVVHFVYAGQTRASCVLTTYLSDLYSNDLVTPITVGGINSGSIFLDIPIVGMLDALLYPELFPTLTSPSSAFFLTQAGFHEIGEVIASLDFNALFSRGTIVPPYGTSGFRSGLPNTYNYTGTGLPAAVVSTALTDTQNVLAYTVLSGVQAWTNTVSYDIGEQPKSNKGHNYNIPFPAGTTSVKTETIIGVYPYFATTVDITVLTKQPLALMNSAYVQTNMVAEDDLGDKQTAEFPVAWSAITGIEFYNVVLSRWEWLNGSKANSLTTFAVTAVTETIQGNIINYNRYTNTSSKIGARMLRWHTD